MDHSSQGLILENNPDFDHSRDQTNYGIFASDLSAIPDPKNIDEAMASPFREKWLEAMQKEITSLKALGAFDETTVNKVPSGRKLTKGKWVFKVKYKRDGTIEKFKCRYVACGYSQQEGVDFDQTFSATMRSTSFRTICALSAQNGLNIDHMDVSNAYTQSDIDCDIWVEAPRLFGYEEGSCWKLKRPYTEPNRLATCGRRSCSAT